MENKFSPFNFWSFTSQYTLTEAMQDILSGNLDDEDIKALFELTKNLGFKC